MKPTTALTLLGLLASSVISGCANTEYIHVKPQCSPPAEPAIPSLDRGELWDTFIDAERYRNTDNAEMVGDGKYRLLERHVNAAWAWGDEQAAMLEELCDDQP